MIIIFRKYYLFKIKKDVINSYSNDELFIILKRMYYLKCNNFLGVSLFNQVCDIFDRESINSYFFNKNKTYIKFFNGKFFINDYRIGERSCVQVNNSCIVVKTNCNFPYLLKIFLLCSKNIFVCDFVNEDYFFLNDFCNSHNVFV